MVDTNKSKLALREIGQSIYKIPNKKQFVQTLLKSICETFNNKEINNDEIK